MNLNLLHYLVQCWPQALEEQDDDGMTPLHLACKLQPERTILYIYREFKDAIFMKDKCLCLPIHLASARFELCTPQVAQILVSEYPACVWDANGNLPIHCAVVNSQQEGCHEEELQFLQHLINQWPNFIYEKNNKRNLPLHLACLEPIENWDVKLLANGPKAVEYKNKNENLALHHALC